MEKTYQPQEIETKWYSQWESSHYFKNNKNAEGTPYCIMLPPPNVTGSLHMGHGFQQTLMDALIRYHRMLGDPTLWQAGTDHAGIATQMVVERQLSRDNVTRHDLGRDEFVKRVHEWKKTSGNTITGQMRRLGTSVDWQRERFTMDEQYCKVVLDVFIKLYEEGLIYRGKRLVNWDPTFQTAISDLEVVNVQEQGSMWHIKYPLASGDGHVVIATTRPETLLGDTAVAVNPTDTRYTDLIGKEIKLPLTDRTIPIITDDYVDPAFGSGCVKITPAHDFNDYAVGKRHDLPMINILNPDATLNKNSPEKYRGMDRFDAREQIIKDLKALNLIEKIEPHTLSVPRGESSNNVIEPYLTHQWFVKAKELAEPALEAVRQEKIRFVPENWTKTYYQWLENIEDWCISRQLWWGHRMPAWYDKDNNIYVGKDEADVRAKYKLNDNIALTQDTDVLDTWFSSSLWPFATLGWPEKTPELQQFYPGSVIVTGFDIIFFWVARMIMMGLHFTDEIPFHDVYITGLIRDSKGHKMSKSKGNVLDPLDLIDGISLEDLITKRTSNLMQPKKAKSIEQDTRKEFPEGIPAFGTDALRFTFAALATTGRDIRFDFGRTEGYRNFCNKLWNAARYVLMNTEDQDLGKTDAERELSDADKWILQKLSHTIEKTHEHFTSYRFDLLAAAVYEFTWHEYCDWYLELSKPILYGDDVDENLKRGTRYTLIYVLETLLRLMHPIMPFITEEIWQRVGPLASKSGETIMLQPYPVASEIPGISLEGAHHNIEWLKQIVVGIRTIRSEMNISPTKLLPILLNKGTDNDRKRIDNNKQYLMSLAKLESIVWLDAGATPPPSATALAGDMEILIPMAGLIDKDAESNRLTKEISKLNSDLQKAQNKLANPNYINKAPSEVVAKEREKVEELSGTIDKLSEQLERIAAL